MYLYWNVFLYKKILNKWYFNCCRKLLKHTPSPTWNPGFLHTSSLHTKENTNIQYKTIQPYETVVEWPWWNHDRLNSVHKLLWHFEVWRSEMAKATLEAGLLRPFWWANKDKSPLVFTAVKLAVISLTEQKVSFFKLRYVQQAYYNVFTETNFKLIKTCPLKWKHDYSIIFCSQRRLNYCLIVFILWHLFLANLFQVISRITVLI